MIYRFGNYEVDDSARELRRGGATVETEPKAFEVLASLVAHHDRAEDILVRFRLVAGESWTADDEATLAENRE